MNPYEADLPVVYLMPGEAYFAEGPALVVTVLGSCLSVTMFSSRLKLGAICHGLLPKCKEARECDGACAVGFKYVDCSIRRMVEQFRRRGVPPGELDVKLFGGADMFGAEGKSGDSRTIGKQNIMAALQLIEAEGLTINTSDVGGTRGRKIFFLTDNGDIYLKRLRRNTLSVPPPYRRGDGIIERSFIYNTGT